MRELPVVQVWVNPRFPDAHRDPRLRAWLADNALKTGMAAIVRYGLEAGPGLVLAPPTMTADKVWMEIPSQLGEGVGLWSGKP